MGLIFPNSQKYARSEKNRNNQIKQKNSNSFELNWDDVGKANLVYEPFDQGKKR